MLSSLSIKNYALIEDVQLSLKDNLTILTGETGAGKSILLGALSLLLGKRADLESVRNRNEKCVIEGNFFIDSYSLKPLFKSADLDYHPETIIRREILPSGRSRAFVNDTPVKLKPLQALGQHLVDIHSQHETLFMGNAEYQFQVIDALAGNVDLLKEYQTAFQEYKILKQEMEALKQEQQEAQKTYDYHLFLRNELREVQLEENMQTDLEERFKQLSHVEELKENLSISLQQLEQEDIGILEGMQEVKNRLSALEDFGEAYSSLSNRMKSVLLELEDMAQEMNRLYEDAEGDPEALTLVNEKLQAIYRLQQKHGVNTVAELLTLQAELEEKVAVSEDSDQALAALQQQIDKAEEKTRNLAHKLTQKRKKIAPKFRDSVVKILQKLGMPHGRLKIELTPAKQFTPFGLDKMQWLFSANKGSDFLSLKKGASGGELSRISLAIKSILAQYSNLPTIIFDEIDTGVSGEIAQKMGSIMAEMGQQMQVISITHLPQIAAKGKQHYKVFKKTQNKTTRTFIKSLTPQERIAELAEMLGGKERPDSAMAHAKTLLATA